MRPGGYGRDISAFEEDHPGVIVRAGFEGVGYTARLRGNGAKVASAVTLDALAAALDALEEEQG